MEHGDGSILQHLQNSAHAMMSLTTELHQITREFEFGKLWVNFDMPEVLEPGAQLQLRFDRATSRWHDRPRQIFYMPLTMTAGGDSTGSEGGPGKAHRRSPPESPGMGICWPWPQLISRSLGILGHLVPLSFGFE